MKRRAFSLVELLIAIVIFLLLAVPLLSLFTTSSKNTYLIEKKLSSLDYAESILNFLTEMDYADLPPLNWEGDILQLCNYIKSFSPSPQLLGVNEDIKDFLNLYPQLKLNIKITGDNFIDDVNHVYFSYKLINLTVSFVDNKGKKRSFQLSGLVKK